MYALSYEKMYNLVILSEICNNPRINCLMTQWSSWSDCKCSGPCTYHRTRSIRRLASCGGEKCGHEYEEQGCIPPEREIKLYKKSSIICKYGINKCLGEYRMGITLYIADEKV